MQFDSSFSEELLYPALHEANRFGRYYRNTLDDSGVYLVLWLLEQKTAESDDSAVMA